MENVRENIDYKVKGYLGKWNVIDKFKDYALLENNAYGDETCYLVVQISNNVEELDYTKSTTGEKIRLPTVIEVVCETHDDIVTALRDEEILQ